MIPKGAALRTSAIQTLAAAVVAIVFGHWATSLSRQGAISLHDPFELIERAVPGLIVLTAYAVFVAAGRSELLARRGWFVTAAGFGLTGALTYGAFSISGFHGDLVRLATAVGLGAGLGGVWLAAATTTRFERIAMTSGFAIGLGVTVPYSRFLEPIAWDYLVAVAVGPSAVAAVIAVIAGLVVAKATKGTTVQSVRLPDGWLSVVGTAFLLVLGGLAISQFLLGEQFRGSGWVRHSDLPVSLALALLIGTLFTMYAFRVGRFAAARWIVISMALAAPVGQVIEPIWSSTRMPVEGMETMVLTTLIGTVSGLLLAWRADKILPWDAIGVGMVGAVQLLVTIDRRDATEELTFPILLAGVGLACGSGLIRLARSAQDGAFAGMALLGFAGWLLTGQLLTTISIFPQIMSVLSLPPAVLPSSTIAAAIVLAVLFVASKFPARTPRPVSG